MIKARAKSLFIYPAVALSLLLSLVAAGFALAGGPERAAWWGAAFAGLPLPFTLWRLRSGRIARTTENLPLALLVACGGVFVAAWEWLMERVAGWPPLVVASVSLLLLLLYVFWYSRYGRIGSSRLDVGGKLPEFSLQDARGNRVASSELLGQPAVLVFYRGNWSPVCLAQLREIAARHEEFAQLGSAVVFISSQPAERTSELAGQLDAPLAFWVDEGNTVAESLHIAVRDGVPAWQPGNYGRDTVMPTVVVTNANGTIVYADQTDSYRVRPEPDVFLAILRRAGAIAR
ncbi:MAG: peroxiredoxin family protein [Woeseiaceae bacterium]|nr:peroxiredoxin family protein [Woeseiaceae bacterium]